MDFGTNKQKRDWNMNKKEKFALKYSYICNSNEKIKCPDSKWRKIKRANLNTKKFDFKSRTRNLLEVKSILEGMKIPFFLTHGALLGAYRNHDYIKYDDDIELDPDHGWDEE